ncbi:helix-turn-helix domain-containing protein [Levilactobacillus acidifarinae]|nr:helix-turn-helix domain-containing protein [Levilactobacillus acidifarinae]GEO69327.1 hypothetical protein LAC03_12370 [Levilactobacillus acidifarinae]
MRPFFAGEAPQLQLLTQLDTQATVVTVTALARTLGWDRNTVSRQLQDLQAALAPFAPAVQLNWDARGVHYWRRGDFNLGTVVSTLVRQSYAGQIFEDLMSATSPSLIAFGLRIHLSESTVRRSLRQVTKTLRAYGVTVATRAWQLQGPEPAIRYLLFQYTWNTYGTVSWPFKTPVSVVRRTLTLTLARLGVTLAASDRLKATFWLGVSQDRQHLGHHLADETQWVTDLIMTELLPAEQWWQRDSFVEAHRSEVAPRLAAWQRALPPLTATAATALVAGLTRSLVWQHRFNDAPLLVGGDQLLAVRRQQPTFQRAQRRLQAAGLWPQEAYGQLRAEQLLRHCWPQLVTPPTVTVVLAVDAAPVDRQAFQRQLQHRYAEQWRVKMTTDTAHADLVVTNYNVTTTRPVLYLNLPVTLGDWQRLDTWFAQLVQG